MIRPKREEWPPIGNRPELVVRNDRASHHVRAFDPRISVRRAAPIAVRSRLNAKDVSPHEDFIVITQRDRLCFARLHP